METHENSNDGDVVQLKKSLDSWKPLLVSVYNVLEWQRKSDPILIISVDSLLFFLLAYYDPPLLTTISLIALAYYLLVTIVPLVSTYVFKHNDWNTASEARFTRLCERISHFNRKLSIWGQKLTEVRQERHSLYFFVVFFVLLFFAYVGQKVNNFLLTYLTVLALTLAPGIAKHKLWNRVWNRNKPIETGSASLPNDKFKREFNKFK